MPKYNGHDNYNAWNVSLWLYNDEGMYNLMRECVRRSSTKDKAAIKLLDYLPEKTPDGVKFNYTNVRKALRDM